MSARAALAWVALALLGGCAASPPTRFISLTAVEPADRSGLGAGPERSGPTLGVGEISLPPALERRALVKRWAAQDVEIDGFVRWAAPLDEIVRRTLAFDLAARLPEGAVVLPGPSGLAEPQRWLVVAFERFAPGADAALELDARWSLVDARSRDALLERRARIEIAEPGRSYPDSVAAAMSEALAGLADQVASAVLAAP